MATVMAEAEEPFLASDDKKGGFRTLPFIIANDVFEKMATFGLAPSMALYLMNQYHMEIVTTSNLLSLWNSVTSIMPLFGAIIADSYLGRFYTIGVGSVICLIGTILLWSTTVIPHASPPPCDLSSNTCSSPTIIQYIHLCLSLALISIGAGGIGASSLAFGINQLEKEEFRRTPAVKESYIGWYYALNTFGILIGYTCVVYIQENLGWGVGFAVPALLMLLAVISFFLASPFYIKLKSESSLVIGLIRVVVASYRNRHLNLSDDTHIIYHCRTGSTHVFPSRKLRFLNKACVVRDIRKDLSPDGEAINPWSLCTVEQVEELKALLRVLPIWSTGMIMSINVCQGSYSVLQVASMDRHIILGFTIPMASFGTFVVVAAIVWIVLYDRLFLPLASKLMGNQAHVSAKTRMGFGIFISFLSMMATALVENVRRGLANKEGYLDNPQVAMSALWLIPQNCLIGIAEASNSIAQNEFYFSEFSRSMSSIASTLVGIGMFVASLLAIVILNAVDKISKSGGNESWMSTDVNKGHYDYYYLILAGLSMANFLYFLVCSRAYGPSKEEQERAE